jgi:hypothetical protein
MNNEQAADLAVTKRLVEDLHNRLVGPDGESGALGKLEDRVDSLEKTKARGEGMLGLLTLLVSLIGGGEILHWFKGK